MKIYYVLSNAEIVDEETQKDLFFAWDSIPSEINGFTVLGAATSKESAEALKKGLFDKGVVAPGVSEGR